MVRVDVTIIGAGVVGLSIAREICSSAGDVVVMEKESGPGKGISSRNSEVIHAGIYYPEGSLKARLCVQGSRMLYAFCQAYGVPFRKTGKVIVAANPQEEKAIEQLFFQGVKNEATGLRVLGKKELRSLESNVLGLSALHSPHTGIIDSHRLIKVLEAMCLERGASILYRTRLIGLDRSSSGYICTVCGPGGQEYSFASRVIVNAAGLSSDQVAGLAGIDIDAAGYRIYPVKGEYFRVCSGKHTLVNGLVYPVPEENLTGLGVHATKDLSGSLRLGPNAFPVEDVTYDVDPSHGRMFFEKARHLLPFLEPEDLMPDMAGIRPKIQKPGYRQRDFVISHESGRGLPGMLNLVGMESPGLTSCLAIGKHTAEMMQYEGLVS